jgi:lactate permease
MWQLLFSYFPIVLLIYLMTKKNSMASSKALPLVAMVLYFIMLIVFKQDANLVHANVVKGLLVAWTPILIIAGAIFLFRTMEVTGCLNSIKQWLNTVSENKIAQLMIVGWAFVFLLEGASGFGTPAAIAAPILVGLGFPPVRVAILTLILNGPAVSFGAVGTPTWFGLSAVDLSAQEILVIGFKSALMNGAAALIIPFIALMFVVKPKSVFKNWVFILLSILSTMIPYIIVAKYNYEFPTLIGGTIGLIMTILFAKWGIGLSKSKILMQEKVGDSKLGLNEKEIIVINNLNYKKLLKATFPLWGTVLLLVISRITSFGIKDLLTLENPQISFSLGSLGVFSVSPSLTLSLTGIFGTLTNWKHQLLFVPSLLPFGLISLITFWIYSSSRNQMRGVWVESLKQLHNPIKALLGALVFVNLMMMGGDASAVSIIGESLANITGHSWKYFASFLGAIGTFFSGSNTISNLTFSGIQDSIAQTLSLNRTNILAMQSVGGAMGTMISINNIVAVASVLALGNIEGYILKRTVRAMLVYGLIVAIVAIFL